MSIRLVNRAEKETYTFFDKRVVQPEPELYYRSDFSILFIEKGEGVIQVNGQTSEFSEQNIIVIGPYIPHRIVSAHDSLITAIVFRMKAMGEDFINCCQLSHIRSFLERSSYGLKYSGSACRKAFRIADRIENTFGFREVINLFEILDILSLSGNHKILTNEPVSTPIIDKNKQMIDRIKHYIEQHSQDVIYVEALAQQFNMAESTFIRFFKSNAGVSFTKYLNRVRIDKACHLLTTCSDTIASISATVGYSSLSNFNRQFRCIIGTTPRQYRCSLCA
ncbi:helix-turn-helix domain-containing protein [Kistimonas asteriae]|uniref:helix-turn-helix domain-containing protein n=1 Tax=Kistimonas asteriae TaxID=517724 RepID=UPI001BA5CF28|nr:AraC family transcriptional regulator [Kistimonas asteriae]